MKYCTYCGKEKEEQFSGYFDEDTGEKKMISVCVNLKCVSGCGRAGHDFRGFFFSNKCRRCGEEGHMD